MKCSKIIIFVLIGTILGPLELFFPKSDADTEPQQIISENDKAKTHDKVQKREEDPVSSKADKKSEEKPVPITRPIYRPPLRGAPVGRIAGGTRGIQDEVDLLLCVLTPDHTGLTTQDQPSLYFFLGGLSRYPIELTVIEDQGIHPILEKPISPPAQPGIQVIHLHDYDLRLERDKEYKWFVTIMPDPVHRSKDILAWGAIRRIELPESLRKKLAHADKANTPHIYADAGIWYDAFSEVSNLINLHPNNLAFQKQRSTLLEQVALQRVVKCEMK
ncbi:MAG: DUF928 domain-containing protein [Desulfobacterales bacterium]|nr:MAG: DUF928 domain-containing protein [Desulfobacterales bacterium]